MTIAGRSLQHVVCIDDDPDILMITKFALEEVGGFKVTGFHGPLAALEGISLANPDLILMDVMMPTMDGPTTLKALRGEHEDIQAPVVFMTARVQPHEVKEYIALGAAGVISKPYDPLTLASTLQDIWRSVSETKITA